MEGKAVLFKEFGGVDAFPVCLDTKDEDRIVEIVKAIAPSFGGINLEDISAPRCFSIEERLREELDIPVFHDDQHGTAIVTVAALTNALRIVKKDFENIRVVFSGVGAAGIAVSKILMASGVRHIIGCDKTGAVHRGRMENMNFMKDWFAEHTNQEGLKGTLADALEGADVFVGLSGPGVLTVEMLKKMARDPIVFAMANPEPEIRPEVAQPYVRIMATGRSDYPNQINNVLAFPGVFRGALDCRARSINEEMKKAAALALANIIPKNELSEDYIIPSVFNKRVAKLVATAVMKAAAQTGVARRARKHTVMDLL
jgi:malate dehydrogenase (oxaloacetate-decarboxylating)